MVEARHDDGDGRRSWCSSREWLSDGGGRALRSFLVATLVFMPRIADVGPVGDSLQARRGRRRRSAAGAAV